MRDPEPGGPTLSSDRVMAADAESPPWTLVQFAVDRVRSRILSGELPADRPIRIGKLAAEFGMSAIPMREALQVLAAEGMVASIPRRGYTVATLTIKDLDDTYRMRAMLEPLAIELSVPHITDRELARIREELQRFEDGGPHSREHHREAHFLFYGGCDSVWLLRCIEIIWQNAQRYQVLTGQIDGELARRLKEHWYILEAVEAGDAAEASRRLKEHLERAAAKIREYLANLPRLGEQPELVPY